MPEYLAPAVYVEEVDTGSKPIEGVSTSTAGMIGATERGPVNVPILVTSFGEYQRWFGQYLDPTLFDDERCYLPHAVEGFFTNGGKRVYVVRVLDASAAGAASRDLVARGASPVSTQLLSGAAAGATNIIVVDGTGLAGGNTLQLGAGTGAELRTISAVPTTAHVLPLQLPLSFQHAATDNVHLPVAVQLDSRLPGPHASTLQAPAAAGADQLTVLNLGNLNPVVAAGDLLRIGAAASNDDEYVFVRDTQPGDIVRLRAPLSLSHAAGAQVVRQEVDMTGTPPQTPLAVDAARGAVFVQVANAAGFNTPGDFLQFAHTNPVEVEIRRVGRFARIDLSHAVYADYPAESRVEAVTFPGPLVPVNLTAEARVGATVIQVSDRSAMNVGDIVQIGLGADIEYVEISALPAALPAPNPGAVVLRNALRAVHLAPTPAPVVFRFAPALPVTFTSALAVEAPSGTSALTVTSDTGFAAGGAIRVTTPGGARSYHVLSAAPVVAAANRVPLSSPLLLPQVAGAPVGTRTPILEVRAIDAGAWGNRLQVGVEVQEPPLLATAVRQVVSNTSLRLRSAAGVESGTELVIMHSGATEVAVKVSEIDRQNDYLITLEASTPLPAPVSAGSVVRSREYRFVTELLRQPDPANPARNNVAIDREVFAAVSLDSRHSRYAETVIGVTWNMTNPTVTSDDRGVALRKSDRRSEGQSSYIRVRDLAPGTGLRRGPSADYETRPDGTQRLILLRLAHGDDALSVLTDVPYIGLDHAEPDLRTGLFALRNIEDISIVAAPGRTSSRLQGALITHCELARYRFAVLDGNPPPTDTMASVQLQRQQFDTKYAALYHPWLVIPDPYPLNPAAPADYPIPPSGHMLGIYARTDIERGVHKAPANEVVRGVTGLQRLLNKEQHDILNPYPVNINVIRDFRNNNRGIRVYGGRVITSDSDWKYVNVRRLLIFIEASIDRGLQWVVFEPNAEPLWARVRRSISNFLTLVWRNGALEGTRVEEAYFVKCDRTTMTQTDIDQGRLICLVGVAPVKPAEFVIVRIGLWTAHAEE